MTTKKQLKLLVAVLLLMTGLLPVYPAEPVTIPTASGSYIDWSKANVENATIENAGANVGSTGKNTVVTFTIQNDTQQDYILTFATGSKSEAKMQVTLTHTTTHEVALTKDVTVVNTGGWTLATTDNYLISQLPTGTYELKFRVTEAGSYAGNWGKLALYSTDDYNKAPGTVSIATGSYGGGARLENNDTNVGWVSNGTSATYSFICTQAGVYKMTLPMTRYGDGIITTIVTDNESADEEARGTWTMTNPSNYADTDVPVEGELTTGLKTLTMQFATTSSFLLNYKDFTLKRLGDYFAKIASVAIENQEVTVGDDSDWYCQLPAEYAATTTFSVSASHGSVTASAEGVDVTDHGDGTFTLPTPAPGNTRVVTLTLTPDDGAYSGQQVYTLKLFRIGEISLTDVTVDGVSIDVLTDLNDNLTATYQNTYTTMPVVKAQCVDGNWFEPTGKPVVEGSKATYSFHITMAGKAKDYTLVIDGTHIYNKVEGDKTIQLKYLGEQVSNKVWSDGLYSLSPIGDGWANSGFKMKPSDGPFTLTVPVDVKVKQFIIREFSDNYAAGSFASLTSEGMTAAYIPAKHDFINGSKYDLIVNLDNHQAGVPLQFSFTGGSQTTGWFELTVEQVAVTSAPVLKSQSVTPTTDKNHCVVALSFDREMADATATIGTQTIKVEGGTGVLYFSVWNLDYDKEYTFTAASADVKDMHGNAIAADITIPVVVGSKPVVEQKAFDYVVSTVSEFKAAIAAVNQSNKSADASRKVIFVKNGDYDFGSTEQNMKAYNVSIVGESMEGVILHGLRSDIQNPIFQINNTGGNYFQDITFRNDKDFDKANREGVGAAVSGGKKAVFVHVAMQSQQDTQVTGESGYYLNCKLYGAVDFICGGGDHYYDQCELIMTNGGYITAPSTSSVNKWGYVFQNCTVNGYEGSYSYNAPYYLGRPWQGEPRTYFLNTRMNLLPNNDGWGGMGTLKTHFYEYHSTDKDGNVLDLSVRKNSPTSTNTYNPWLTDEEAARFTVENVLGGTDSWLPTEATVQTAAPTVTASQMQLSWEAVDDARCYVIFKDGDYLTNQTATTFTATEEGDYTVRAANLNGGMGLTSESVKASTTTGITEVQGSEFKVQGSEMYNLNGQRVNASHKGLVIVNGRKVMIK